MTARLIDDRGILTDAEGAFMPLLLALLLICSILCLSPCGANEDPATALAQVSDLSKRRCFNKAKALLAPLLRRFPEDAQVRLTSARLLKQMGALDQSITEYEKVERLAPSLSEPLVALSEMHLKNLNSRAALAYAHKAVSVAPNSIDARRALICALMTGGDMSGANRHLEKLVQDNINNAKVQYLAYQLNEEQGQLSLAERYLSDAIRLNPGQIMWLIDLSEICQVKGDYCSARSCLAHVLARDPNCVDAINRLAVLLEFFFHDYDGALRQYQQILQLDPDSVTALAGIDRCRIKRNDLAVLIKDKLRRLLFGSRHIVRP